MNSKPDQIAASYIKLIPLLFTTLNQPSNSATVPKKAADLTHLQYHILEELFHHKEGITVTELSKKIQISKQQLTPLISKLESNGLLLKEADVHDKRAVRLRLSERGEQPVVQRWETYHRVLSDQLSSLGEEDLTDFDYALGKIKHILSRLK